MPIRNIFSISPFSEDEVTLFPGVTTEPTLSSNAVYRSSQNDTSLGMVQVPTCSPVSCDSICIGAQPDCQYSTIRRRDSSSNFDTISSSPFVQPIPFIAPVETITSNVNAAASDLSPVMSIYHGIGQSQYQGISLDSSTISMNEMHRARFNYDGRCVKLCLPIDKHILNPVQTFVRSHLIEVFASSGYEAHIRSQGKGSRPIKANQVGIRCIYCKHLSAQDQTNQAVSYPSSLQMLFESLRNWQRFHLMMCPCIPEELKCEYQLLKARGIAASSSRLKVKQHFVKSAKFIGLRNMIQTGICFKEDVAVAMDEVDGFNFDVESSAELIFVLGGVVDDNLVSDDSSSDVTPNASSRNFSSISYKDSHHTDPLLHEGLLRLPTGPMSQLLSQANRHLVTDFVFMLYNQFEKTHYCPVKDKVHPNGILPGFAGLECSHCIGTSNQKGRFFPCSLRSFTGKLIYHHMIL